MTQSVAKRYTTTESGGRQNIFPTEPRIEVDYDADYWNCLLYTSDAADE